MAAASHYDATVAATGGLTASVASLSTAVAGPDGLQAQHVLKVSTTRTDGKKVFAAIGLASQAAGAAGESQILLQASKLLFVPDGDLNADPVNMMVVGLVNGVATLIVPAARIGDTTITPSKMLVPNLGAISADVGTLTAGLIRNASDSYRIDVTNGRTVVTTGAFMKVTGAPFGSSNQFIEWYGPSQASLASCTEANAIYYLSISGSAYFGGTLSAGVLKNSAQTTNTASNAELVLGPFSTNGGSKSIVLSYSYQSFFSCNSSTGSITGAAGSATVLLEKSINGGAFSTIATLVANETIRNVNVDGEPGIPDGVLVGLAGSLTVTDNQGATTGMVLRARVTARSIPTLSGTGIFNSGQTQNVAVISTE